MHVLPRQTHSPVGDTCMTRHSQPLTLRQVCCPARPTVSCAAFHPCPPVSPPPTFSLLVQTLLRFVTFSVALCTLPLLALVHGVPGARGDGGGRDTVCD